MAAEVVAPRVLMMTSRYPAGRAEQFVTAELEQWAEADCQLVLLPEKDDTPSVPRRPVPDAVQVDDTLITLWGSRRAQVEGLARTLGSGLFWKDLLFQARTGRLSAARLKFTVRTSVQVQVALAAIGRVVRRGGRFDVGYAYWLSVSVVALALAKRKGWVRKVVARAHGTDVHEARRTSGYTPFVRQIADQLDLFAPIGAEGRDVATAAFGIPRERSRVSRLGVGVEVPAGPVPTDQTLHLLSVSSLTPGKRIDRMIDGLAAHARLHPERPVHWVHVGDGPLRTDLQSLAAQRLDDTVVTVEWRGHVDHGQVQQWYRSEPFDLFWNTSQSEGVPVSVMEAMVHGVPALATDVGGVSELVVAPWLLPTEPSADELAQALDRASARCRTPEAREQVRAQVVRDYDQVANHRAFVDAVLEVAR